MAGLFVSASTQTITMGSGSSALANVMGASLSVWINPVSLPTGNSSILGLSNGLTTGSSRTKIGVTSTGQIRGNGRCLDADTNRDFYGTVGLVTLGSWQHLVAVFDYTNKTISLYYNGVFDVTSAALVWGTAPTSNTVSLSMNIGSQHGGGSEYWNGYIDDARVYNRMLSLEEIQTIYALMGVDSIVYGLKHRYLLFENSLGTIISATAGSVKDIADLQQNGASVNNPTYAESQIKYSRKF